MVDATGNAVSKDLGSAGSTVEKVAEAVKGVITP